MDTPTFAVKLDLTFGASSYEEATQMVAEIERQARSVLMDAGQEITGLDQRVWRPGIFERLGAHTQRLEPAGNQG